MLRSLFGVFVAFDIRTKALALLMEVVVVRIADRLCSGI